MKNEEKENKKRQYSKENLQYEPFFSKFNTTKKNILVVLTTLTEYETNLLSKKYGYNLESTRFSEELTETENTIINENITKKIKRRLHKLKQGTHKIIKITDILPNNIDIKYLLNLFEIHKGPETKKFTKLFGKKLERRAFIVNGDLERLKNILERYIMINSVNMKKRHLDFISFIEIFKQYKKENETDEELLIRIKAIIEVHCNDYETELLHRKYGEDYQNTRNNGHFTKEENFIINHQILSKIKYYIKKENKRIIYCKPLLDRLVTNSVEEALKEIEKETEQNQKLLQKKYQKDYLGVTPRYAFTQEENVQIKRIILQINRRIEKNTVYCEPVMTNFDMLTTIEEVLNEIYNESEENQCLLRRKYKDNYLGVSSIDSLSTDENKRIETIIRNIINRINVKRINKTGICKNTLIKIRELMKTDEYAILMRKIGEREAISILAIKYLSLELSLKSLSILTDLSEIYILQIAKDYLEIIQMFEKDSRTLELNYSSKVTKK